MILIIGATGNVGSPIVRKLVDKGEKVRVLTRNPKKVSWPLEVEIVEGDMTNSDTMKASLEGIRKVFLIQAPGSDEIPQIAKQSGVQHIVFLSSSAVESETVNAIGHSHQRIEDLIRQSGVQWTFLRPEEFMSNALQWAKSLKAEKVVSAPFGDVKIPVIDPKDIAAVAVEALVSSEHKGKIYTLTGPEMLTPKERVQILGHVLGQTVRFEDLSESVAEENMKKFAPEDIADAVFRIKREARAHPFGVLPTVEEVTGQKARNFRQWVIDNVNNLR